MILNTLRVFAFGYFSREMARNLIMKQETLDSGEENYLTRTRLDVEAIMNSISEDGEEKQDSRRHENL